MARTSASVGGSAKSALLASAAIVIADQLIKLAIVESRRSLPIELIPESLKLVYARNTGIAFGLFQGNNFLVSLLSIVVVVLIIRLWPQLKSPVERYSAALILGGTLGNLADRLLRGSVVDYIAVTGFPAFNLADAALTLGAAMMFIPYILAKLRGRKKA